jgi:25S rRNA (adenine2142-N1)-methyltransferase
LSRQEFDRSENFFTKPLAPGTMNNKKKRTKPKTLGAGRPPSFKRAPSLSSRVTRSLIRIHHVLSKQKAKAIAAGDNDQVVAIQKEIDKHGGIEAYQQASLLGQANERGGDSSKILLEWLNAEKLLSKSSSGSMEKESCLRMLEVGALSITNACSRSGLFEIERIDLNSQAEGIKQQDFMKRPLPSEPKEQFDIISLSLVLNYVPDAVGRGEMLERTLKFLRKFSFEDKDQRLQEYFPSLFLVLPVFCVTNSRYMNEARLEDIMNSLGYVKVQQKLSNKLAYYLWRVMDPMSRKRTRSFKKVEVRAGKTRNNFAIVLK